MRNVHRSVEHRGDDLGLVTLPLDVAPDLLLGEGGALLLDFGDDGVDALFETAQLDASNGPVGVRQRLLGHALAVGGEGLVEALGELGPGESAVDLGDGDALVGVGHDDHAAAASSGFEAQAVLGDPAFEIDPRIGFEEGRQSAAADGIGEGLPAVLPGRLELAVGERGMVRSAGWLSPGSCRVCRVCRGRSGRRSGRRGISAAAGFSSAAADPADIPAEEIPAAAGPAAAAARAADSGRISTRWPRGSATRRRPRVCSA